MASAAVSRAFPRDTCRPRSTSRGDAAAAAAAPDSAFTSDTTESCSMGPVDDVFDAWQLANDPRPSYGRPADVAPWLRNAFRDDVETLNACLHDVTCSDAVVFAHEALPPLRALDVEPEEVEELLSQIEADAAAACVKITSGSGPALYRARLHGARRARGGAREGFEGAVERVREIELDLDDAWPRPPKSRPRPSSSSSSSFSADRRRRRRRRRGLEDVVAICAAMKRGVPIYIASDVVGRAQLQRERVPVVVPRRPRRRRAPREARVRAGVISRAGAGKPRRRRDVRIPLAADRVQLLHPGERGRARPGRLLRVREVLRPRVREAVRDVPFYRRVRRLRRGRKHPPRRRRRSIGLPARDPQVRSKLLYTKVFHPPLGFNI